MVEFIAPPILGGVIGYITNDIAIKMLFRPRKAIYIGKFHIPFTPGLIPKQKDSIARSIGSVISTQLLNRDTVINTVTSDESLDKVYISIMNAVQRRNDERIIADVIMSHISEENIDMYKVSIQESITLAVSSKINDADIGTKLAQSGIDMIKEKSGMGFVSLFINDELIGKLGGIINNVLAEKAPEIIYDEIGKSIDEILSMRICDVVAKYEDRSPQVIRGFIGLCKMIIEENIDSILRLVNIERIVVDKVSSFDAEELEQMIFGIMHRELRAIVYLGALLGFLLGFVNILFFV